MDKKSMTICHPTSRHAASERGPEPNYPLSVYPLKPMTTRRCASKRDMPTTTTTTSTTTTTTLGHTFLNVLVATNAQVSYCNSFGGPPLGRDVRAMPFCVGGSTLVGTTKGRYRSSDY